MTIPELLTAMTILAFVVSGILAVYVGGIRATDDMNERFVAQQNARLALSSLRNEVSSSCSASVATGGASVTLSIPNVPSGSPANTNGCTSPTQVTWCAASSSGVAPFGLYRQTGATCAASTGVQRAASLTTNAVFAAVTSTGHRPQLQVTLPVDANLASAKGTYRLGDTITLLNGTVS